MSPTFTWGSQCSPFDWGCPLPVLLISNTRASLVLGFPAASDSCCCHLGITPFLQRPGGQAQDGSGPVSDTDGVSRPGGRAEHGARSQQENFPAAGKRRLRPVSQRRAPAGLGLCRRAPIPAEKGVCSRQTLSKSLYLPRKLGSGSSFKPCRIWAWGRGCEIRQQWKSRRSRDGEKTKPPSECWTFFFFSLWIKEIYLLSTERGRNYIACGNAALKEELTRFAVV